MPWNSDAEGRAPPGRRIQGETPPQAGGDVVGRLGEIELAARRMAAIHRNLLERLDQLAGALQIGDKLIGGGTARCYEVVETGAAQRRRSQFGGECLASARETRCHG